MGDEQSKSRSKSKRRHRKTKTLSKRNAQLNIETIASQLSVDSIISEQGATLPAALRVMGYKLDKQIGSGGFSTVWTASNTKLPGVKLACKVFEFAKLQKAWKDKFLKKEMKIMTKLRHKNVAAGYDVHKTQNRAYIFMQFAEHGSLPDYLVKTNSANRVSECQARRWFHGLMQGVAFLHTNNVAHRDLKLDNFLLDEHLEPLITDFSFSAVNESATKGDLEIISKTCCGTVQYLAPEVRNVGDGTYDAKSADLYSMGICLYEMLHGFKPFEGDYEMKSTELTIRQMHTDYKIAKSLHLSDECQKVIRTLLDPKPARRTTARQVLESDWFKGVAKSASNKK